MDAPVNVNGINSIQYLRTEYSESIGNTFTFSIGCNNGTPTTVFNISSGDFRAAGYETEFNGIESYSHAINNGFAGAQTRLRRRADEARENYRGARRTAAFVDATGVDTQSYIPYGYVTAAFGFEARRSSSSGFGINWQTAIRQAVGATPLPQLRINDVATRIITSINYPDPELVWEGVGSAGFHVKWCCNGDDVVITEEGGAASVDNSAYLSASATKN